ncbi:MAG: ATP-binding cassette domain-containing protein [Caldicoprobacterales bacterium]|jgi:putative ABC transport system ATP-binding protein
MFLFDKVKYKDILDIDKLRIEKYKVTSIVGQSGSGKTTLLRLLNKLISCDSGEIYYNGKALSSLDSVKLRREVVMLGQEPVVFSGSIKDNLLAGLRFSEKDLVDNDSLCKVLSLVKLDKDLDQNAENLSGGEKQRLALARIILMEPEVYLLDEPSSALDEETEQIIIEEMVACAKRNHKSLVMVTHSINIARQFSDEIVEIKGGQSYTHGGAEI